MKEEDLKKYLKISTLCSYIKQDKLFFIEALVNNPLFQKLKLLIAM